MKSSRLFCAVTLVLTLATPAHAENWPSRAMTLIVPFAAGGGVDVSARIQAQGMSERLGQAIVVENVGAAAGMAGSLRVAKAEPDGYTMLIGAFNVVLITALSTVGAVIYNLVTHVAGGIEVTLKETD